MTTHTTNDTHSSTTTATDVQSFLNSYKTNTSNRVNDSKRGRTICQPKGTVLYTV